MAWVKTHRLPESTICTVPSYSSVLGIQTTRPYISQNIGQIFQPNTASERVLRFHRRAQGTWTTYENIDVDASDFGCLGEDFIRSDAGKVIRHGKVGTANSQLMPQRAVVDFAIEWLEKNRM